MSNTDFSAMGMFFSTLAWLFRDIGLGIALVWGGLALLLLLVTVAFRKPARVDPELLEKGLFALVMGGLGCLVPLDRGLLFSRTTAWMLFAGAVVLWGVVLTLGRRTRPRVARAKKAPPKPDVDDRAPVGELPYRIRDDFLSPAEFSFYRVLVDVLGASLVICPKVRLADIFFVARPHANRSHFSRIAQKHLDFLVCDAQTLRPVLGIELNDASHQRKDRQQRDVFVDAVFRTAGLPLLRLPTRSGYNPADLARQLRGYLPGYMLLGTPAPVDASSDAPLCPKCGVPMVIKTATRGTHKGQRFYACPNFPQCRTLQPIHAADEGLL